ncbi:MAG: hypothetical protein PHQ23_11690, partial [Candidatus Wallbacteria bacterium]|nr:hypothetical protein [Candidatus Wallbacteria bacterium]
IANGEIERINLYAQDFANLEKRGYGWRALDNDDYRAAGAPPSELDDSHASFEKKVEAKLINKFIAEVTVSVRWQENTTKGRELHQMNVPTLISNPKPFFEYK